MLVINWFKENRLKIVSVMAVTADMLMGLAGGANLFFWNGTHQTADICLIAASAFGLAGHAALLIWGKGGRIKTSSLSEQILQEDSIWLKPFMPWHYPLDWGFLSFTMAGILYALAGVASENLPLFINGALVSSASALGWLWPQDKKILGKHAMQITVILYALSSLSAFFAAYVAQNEFILAAACLYISMNAILYTVRKENQSSFTQSQQGAK
jgi:hypothetical protein